MGREREALEQVRRSSDDLAVGRDEQGQAWAVISALVDVHLAGPTPIKAIAAIDREPDNSFERGLAVKSHHANGMPAPGGLFDAMVRDWEVWAPIWIGRSASRIGFDARGGGEPNRVGEALLGPPPQQGQEASVRRGRW